MPENRISKRQFIRTCALGAGITALGLSDLEMFANINVISNKGMNTPIDLWKWKTKAHYFTNTDSGVQCDLCPNTCLIGPNDTGICRTRVNSEGVLWAINYGCPCSINCDPVEKKPQYHFLPQTKVFSLASAGCNFACLNCQNWQISQASPLETDNYDLMPEAVVAYALKNNCKSIAFTYTEATVSNEFVYDTAILAHEKGLKMIYVSNGYINEKPLRDLCKYIDAASINLKSFKDEIYKKLNGGTLKPVMNTLTIFKEEGVWLEIINLVIPTWTDDMDMIKKMCDWLYDSGLDHFPLHFSRFYPLYKLTQLPSTPVDTLNKAREIAINAGIKYVYLGNVPGTPNDDTYCYKCKKLLIERQGYTNLSNNIKNGKCGFCGAVIHGVWS